MFACFQLHLRTIELWSIFLLTTWTKSRSLCFYDTCSVSLTSQSRSKGNSKTFPLIQDNGNFVSHSPGFRSLLSDYESERNRSALNLYKFDFYSITVWKSHHISFLIQSPNTVFKQKIICSIAFCWRFVQIMMQLFICSWETIFLFLWI